MPAHPTNIFRATFTLIPTFIIAIGLWSSTSAKADGLLCNFRTVLGAYDTPSFAQEIEIVGNVAFITDLSNDLQIIDITIPSAPRS